jgi:hypothetical protein
MTYEQFLLGKIAEEAAELSQIALKCQQFGLAEVMEGQPLTNAERMVREYWDLKTVLRMLDRETGLQAGPMNPHGAEESAHMNGKVARVGKYLEKSVALGQVARQGRRDPQPNPQTGGNSEGI